MLLRVFSVFLLVFASSAWADSIDVSLHDKVLRAIYGQDITVGKGLELEGGVLLTESNSHVIHLGLHVSGENWSDAGTFGIRLGGRLALAHTDPADALALALGGQLRFSPVQRVGIGGFLYYAPAIMTSMDGESYTERGLQVDYQLLPNAFVYVGYRKIEVKFKGLGTAELDDKVHIGMRLLF